MKKSLGPKLLVCPTPVLVVGTYDDDGNPNVMTASWGGICCSQPPCVNVSLRKETYSYHNAIARKAFTLSIPSEEHVRQVDYFGLVSGHHTDKLADAGLTAARAQFVDAPYVYEFPLIIECRLAQTLEIGLHTIFVGEIIDVKMDEAALDAEGNADLGKLKPFCYATDAKKYYRIGEVLAKAFSVGRED